MKHKQQKGLLNRQEKHKRTLLVVEGKKMGNLRISWEMTRTCTHHISHFHLLSLRFYLYHCCLQISNSVTTEELLRKGKCCKTPNENLSCKTQKSVHFLYIFAWVNSVHFSGDRHCRPILSRSWPNRILARFEFKSYSRTVKVLNTGPRNLIKRVRF